MHARRSSLPALALALVLAILTIAPATPALAYADSAGNVFASEDAPPTGIVSDLYWAGQDLELADINVGADVLAAGRTVHLSNATVGGSVRTVSQEIRLDGTTVSRTVTIAGQHVFFGRGSTAQTLYAAGSDVTIAGTVGTGAAIAETLTITGTVKGDLNVQANRLVLGPNARIEGALHATLSEQPARDTGAFVADDSDVTVRPASTSAVNPMAQLVGIASTCLAALALTWLLPVAVDASAVMSRQRALAVPASGAVATRLAAPVAAALVISVAGTPLAFALGGIALTLAFVAAPFAAASLTRLARPGWGRFSAALAGGVVVGTVCSLPAIGFVTSFACVVWLAGCAVQAVRDQMRAPTAHEGHDHHHDHGDHGLPPAGGCGCNRDHGHDGDHRPAS